MVRAVQIRYACTGRSLLWVAALGLVVMYIYSVGTFALLPNEFHDTDDNGRFCESLIQCFVSVLEYGLLDTLGSVSLALYSQAHYSTCVNVCRL